jgi:hypothetical protein
MSIPSTDPVQGCRLIPGFHGIVIQGALILTAFLSLIVKKRFEDATANTKYVRTWREFLLDSSKQIVGSGWVHILNLALSVRLKRKTEAGDSCDWYFANIVVDCTLGTLIEFLLFVLFTRAIIPFLFTFEECRDFESGHYTGKRSYFKQLSVWLVVVTSMKLIVYTILKSYRDLILGWSDLALSRYGGAPEKKLFVVMIVTPLIMNTVQLWIIDNFIKAKRPVIAVADLEKDLVSR